jgi:hypothetical protein
MESRLRLLAILLLCCLACASPGPGAETPQAPAAAGEAPAASEAPAATGEAPATSEAPAATGEAPATSAPEDGTAAGGAEGDVPPKPPASAPATEEEWEFGKTFQPLADVFAFTQYVHASRRGNGLVYQFLPEGETLEDWHYLGVVLLVPVARTWEEAEDVMPEFIEAFLKDRQHVNQVQTIPGERTNLTYIDYELGAGSRREHILASIWQVIPGAITVFQVQRRPERFDAAQIEQFKNVASQLAAQAGRPVE